MNISFADVPALAARARDQLERLSAEPRPLSGPTWAAGGSYQIVPDSSLTAWRVVVLERDGRTVQRFGPCGFAQAVNVGSALGPIGKLEPIEPLS